MERFLSVRGSLLPTEHPIKGLLFSAEDRAQIDLAATCIAQWLADTGRSDTPPKKYSNSVFDYIDLSCWVRDVYRSFPPGEQLYFLEPFTATGQASDSSVYDLERIYTLNQFKLGVNLYFRPSQIVGLLSPSPRVLVEVPQEKWIAFYKSLGELAHVFNQIIYQSKDQDGMAPHGLLGLRRQNGVQKFLEEIDRRLLAGDVSSYQRVFRILRYWPDPRLRDALTEQILAFDLISDSALQQPDWGQLTDNILSKLK